MGRRYCLGEEEPDQFLLLALEKAADAVDYYTPVGIDVDSIRLESNQYLLLAACLYLKRPPRFLISTSSADSRSR